MRTRILGLWRSASIRNKQLFFFACLISVVSVISFYSQYTLYRYLDEFQHTLSGYFTINRYLMELKDFRTMLGRRMRDGSQDGAAGFDAGKRRLRSLLERIDEESNLSLNTYFLLRAMRNGQAVYFSKAEEAIEAKLGGRETVYVPYYGSERIADFMESYITGLLNVRLAEGHW